MDIQDHIIRKIKINNLKENKHDKLNREKSELSKKFNDNKDKSNQEQSIDFPTITQKNEKYREKFTHLFKLLVFNIYLKLFLLFYIFLIIE